MYRFRGSHAANMRTDGGVTFLVAGSNFSLQLCTWRYSDLGLLLTVVNGPKYSSYLLHNLLSTKSYTRTQ